MFGDERLLDHDNTVNAIVGVEDGLDVLKNNDRAVSASAAELTLAGQGGRKSDGIMESKAEGLMDLLAAHPTIKEILLEIVTDGEQGAASCVARGVTIGASDATNDGTCREALLVDLG